MEISEISFYRSQIPINFILKTLLKQTPKMDLWLWSLKIPLNLFATQNQTKHMKFDFTWFDDTLHICHLLLCHSIYCHVSQCVYGRITSKRWFHCFRGSIWFHPWCSLSIDLNPQLHLIKFSRVSCSVLYRRHTDIASNLDRRTFKT